jgi:hypothetical protein
MPPLIPLAIIPVSTALKVVPSPPRLVVKEILMHAKKALASPDVRISPHRRARRDLKPTNYEVSVKGGLDVASDGMTRINNRVL